jgi:hypothetical protein
MLRHKPKLLQERRDSTWEPLHGIFLVLRYPKIGICKGNNYEPKWRGLHPFHQLFFGDK